MNVKNTQVYVYPKFLNSDVEFAKKFKGINVEFNEKAAIGAGASGLMPEIEILIVRATAMVASGFLGAIGADVWRIIKKGVLEVTKEKPKLESFELLKSMQNKNLHYELLMHMSFKDKEFLVLIGLSENNNLETALNLLPDYIDSSMKENSNFGRIFWTNNHWDKY